MAAKPASRAAKAAKKRKVRKKAAKTARKKSTAKARGDSGPIDVVIGPQQGIREIAAIRSKLDEAFAASSAVRLDAGDVESIDTAVLQLLLAFENSMRKHGRSVEWTAQSDEFRRHAELADLARCLGDPVSAASSPKADDDGLLPVF